MDNEKRKIERQDLVDNAIFQLMKDLNPSTQEIKWEIHWINEIRLVMSDLYVNVMKLCTEEEFYP